MQYDRAINFHSCTKGLGSSGSLAVPPASRVCEGTFIPILYPILCGRWKRGLDQKNKANIAHIG